MKVLHVLNELKFSGAEIMYVAAAKVFQQLECELYVVNTSVTMGEYSVYFEKAGYKTLHWPYKNMSLLQKLKYYKDVQRFIRDNKIDVVHVHRSDMKFGMAYCAWRCGIRCVYTLHGIFPSRWFTYPYHVWLRWSAKHLFHQVQQAISDSVYYHEQKYYHNSTVKIYNWYDTSKFYPARYKEKAQIRQELGISDDSLVIISVGGCSYIKRHEDVLTAILNIKKKKQNVIYLHLGEGKTTEDEKAKTHEYRLESQVRFVGNQTNVRKYLIASDIYVMTSRHEGISLTTIEAMACDIPCVLYKVPGLCDFNKEFECSEMIEESPLLLADTILSLYKNKNRQKEIVSNASTLIHRDYDMLTNVKKIHQLYIQNG